MSSLQSESRFHITGVKSEPDRRLVGRGSQRTPAQTEASKGFISAALRLDPGLASGYWCLSLGQRGVIFIINYSCLCRSFQSLII